MTGPGRRTTALTLTAAEAADLAGCGEPVLD